MMVRYGIEAMDKAGFTMNVSLTGAHIRTNNVFNPGTTMQVELEFPAGKKTLWARVVWAKRVPPALAHVLPCGMGVRFVDPPEDWQETFERWERG
jgi:hypothetical protein